MARTAAPVVRRCDVINQTPQFSPGLLEERRCPRIAAGHRGHHLKVGAAGTGRLVDASRSTGVRPLRESLAVRRQS